MPTRRIVFLCLSALLVAGLAITVWQAYQLQRDLQRAQSSVDDLRGALRLNDVAARDRALADLQVWSLAAESRTGGAWWGALTHVPLIGDDAEGLRVLASTLSLVSTDGVAPMAESVDELGQLSVGDRIDLDAVAALEPAVTRASEVFSSASRDVDAVNTSGFLGLFKQRYIEYADQLDSAATSLRSAAKAVEVLPDMLGADGPRNYLLLFQNNAEIRATGGMPGSWAQIHAEDGRLDMRKQGSATDFPVAEEPVLPLTPEEREVYGAEIGTFFQDPGFAPDFPRAAELWNAHWDLKFPGIDLDGVLALDPVGMSYFLGGTGPVRVDGRTLTASNVIDELLSRPYLELEPAAQDSFFENAAGAIFDAVTDQLASPIDFVEGMSRAAREGRLLVAPFDFRDQQRLRDSNVLGELAGDDGSTPHVDIGLNDATASKMSFYLRYGAEVESISCEGGRQQLSGRMTLNQAIDPSQAARLPDSVTGGGRYGTEPGSQVVPVRIYAPVGGSLGEIRFNGQPVESPVDDVEIEGRSGGNRGGPLVHPEGCRRHLGHGDRPGADGSRRGRPHSERGAGRQRQLVPKLVRQLMHRGVPSEKPEDDVTGDAMQPLQTPPGATVLVTGGTGSFGSTVVRRLLAGDVAEVRIFSRDELKQDDMRRALSDPRVRFYIGDVRDYDSVHRATRGVDFVFHAAALKQVPSCEFFPLEAVRTNVLGSSNVIEASNANEVGSVVCLGTDKAAYPINAMGM